MKFKNIFLWTAAGSIFGVFFGASAALFENGPSVSVGIQQSWWWFALAGFLKSTIEAGLEKRNTKS